MTIFKHAILAASAACFLGGAASAVTLDFDSGSYTWSGNELTGYEQDGFSFQIEGDKVGSTGANLFFIPCPAGTDVGGINPNDQASSCYKADDGDLSPTSGPADAVSGNILIRQDSNPRQSGGNDLADDAATAGTIKFTLLSGPAFEILGFGAVDEQPMQIEAGGGICGPIETGGNSVAGIETCVSPLFVDTGGSFTVRFAGSGGIDNIQLHAMPLPAGLPLLAAGLGGLVLLRRRKS